MRNVPPFQLILRPFNRPDMSNFVPFDALLVIRCLIILSCCLCRNHEFTWRFRNYGRLSTFACQSIHISHTVRRGSQNISFINVRRQTLRHMRVPYIPKVTIYTYRDAVKMSPMAFTPVTNSITSSNVESNNNGSVHFYLRMLYRRTAMKYPCTASLFDISGIIFNARFLYSFSSLISYALSPYVCITNKRLLTRTNYSTKLSSVGSMTRYHVCIQQVPIFR